MTRALTNLSNNSAARCNCIVEAGALFPLVTLLGRASDWVAEQAAGALANLAYGSNERRLKINELGAANFLRPLLCRSSSSLIETVAGTLHILGH